MKKRVLRVFAEISRHHITALLLFTVFDIVLLAMQEDMTVCFSLLFPQQTFVCAYHYPHFSEVVGFRIWSWVIIAISFALFIICLVGSYKRPAWLLCASVLELCDTAIAVSLAVIGKDSTYYWDVGIHVWVMLALIAGYFLLAVLNCPDDVKCVCEVCTDNLSISAQNNQEAEPTAEVSQSTHEAESNTEDRETTEQSATDTENNSDMGGSKGGA